MRSLFMISSSGKLLFEVLDLLLTVRKCCHIVLVSLEFITDSEKCLFSLYVCKCIWL